jgi:imidazole glycerol-phosphate synthase subunit HisF
MFLPRVIPCLLLRQGGLVKTRRFAEPIYLGDPVNTVRIFSDKEVDELVVLDIDASRQGGEPDYETIEAIAGECFMPLAYGGGVRTIEQVRRLVRCGVEKVIVTSAAARDTTLITEAASVFGSQAVVGGLEVRRAPDGTVRLTSHSLSREVNATLEEQAQRLVQAGAGELLINDADRDGTMSGYDLDLIRRVTGCVNVPVVACGGAGGVQHLRQAIREAGACAVAVGSLVVLYGRHRAVLVHYLPRDVIQQL